MLTETIAAVNRTPPVALAAYAGSGISGGNALRTGINASKLAIAATCRLVLEALFRIKFLFARAEDEFFSAVLAYECFVFKSH